MPRCCGDVLCILLDAAWVDATAVGLRVRHSLRAAVRKFHLLDEFLLAWLSRRTRRRTGARSRAATRDTSRSVNRRFILPRMRHSVYEPVTRRAGVHHSRCDCCRNRVVLTQDASTAGLTRQCIARFSSFERLPMCWRDGLRALLSSLYRPPKDGFSNDSGSPFIRAER